MYLDDILDMSNLEKMIEEGYISKSAHPHLDLMILNYTQKTMWDSLWNNETMWSRGLIYEVSTNKIIAMGPKKFFNYGQTGAPELPLSTPARISKKLDGSLGIVWNYANEWGVATRGSFTSDQAIHATELINDKTNTAYSDLRFLYSGDSSTVVEIIYPSNRIVVDYGGLDSLEVLGSVNHYTGIIDVRPSDLVVSRGTLADAVSYPIPSDEEGYVVDLYTEDGTNVIGHVKLKGEDYKKLHYIMTGLSGRKIWEMMFARFIAENNLTVPRSMKGVNLESLTKIDTSKSILEMLGDVPDEFEDWVRDQISGIERKVNESIWNDATLVAKLKDLKGRERYEAGKGSNHFNQINRYINTGDPTNIHFAAWESARPGVELPFRKDEDA